MLNDSWITRLVELQQLLTVCPTDLLARCDLALLLERLDQYEEAHFNWTAVLATDPNNLKAREGIARCRSRTGRPLQSRL
jgi:cytochrome c-type biogenesis protein CcmH/NrfG